MKLRTATLAALAVAALASTAPASASSLAVNGTAAMGGTTYGLQVSPTIGSDAYVQDDSPNNETTYTARFWVGIPADLTMTLGSSFRILRTNDTLGQNLLVFIQRDAINTFRLVCWANDNGGTWRNVGGFFLTNVGTPVTRQIEVTFARETGGLNNGTVTMTRLNTGLTVTRSNLDNDTREINRIRIGVFDNTSASAGSWWFDEFESFR